MAERADTSTELIVRRGPLLALAVAMVLVVATRDELGGWGPVAVCAVVAGIVLAGHVWVVERRWGEPLDDGLGCWYWWTRTTLAFVACLAHPLFGLFATIGYFDTHAYLPRRQYVPALFPVAVTMAGVQSGGLPPQSAAQALLFVGLLVLNAGIAMTLGRIAVRDADQTDEREATIAELEVANRRLEEAIAANERLQGTLLSQARESGIHEERERLALEIHDTIAQGLIGIVTQLQAADDAPHEAAGRHRQRAADLAREALGEARRSVRALGPSPLVDADLDDAVRTVVDGWSAATGVTAELIVTGEPEPVAADVAAAVVRVAQEALSNVARHASATRVGVTVSYVDDEVLLDVRDDGAGFDPDRPAVVVSDGGFGIPGMRTRARRLGGELVVEAERGLGTAVSLRVPAVTRG